MSISESRDTCIVCLGKIYRSSGRPKFKERRSINSLTCSKGCSRIYQRSCYHLRRKYNYQIKVLKNRIRKLENESNRNRKISF